ncbi:MAG: peptidylprolyl isomerase [Gammaproteobacteria bacterium]
MKPTLPILLCTLWAGVAVAAGDAVHTVIEDGAQVSLEITVTDETGKQVQSTVGGAPVEFTPGDKKLLPALEQALMGLKKEARRSITLPPEQAWGKIDPELVVEVDPQEIPAESRKPGAVLTASDTAGVSREVRVKEVHPDKVLVDYNAPLAGRTLTFAVRVLNVR